MMTIQQALDLARRHEQANRTADAEAIYRQILSQHPNQAEALHALGVLLGSTGRSRQGLEFVQRAVALAPGQGEYLCNLGAILDDLGEFEQALVAHHAALAIRSDYPEVLSNLGNTLKDLNRLEEAVKCYRKAVALMPNYGIAHYNLATTLHAMGLLDESIAACRRSLGFLPDFPALRWQLGLVLLLKGNFEQGWPEYEWRWRVKQFQLPQIVLNQPPWKRDDPAGKRILLYAEQGIGDTIQFLRFAPLLTQRGATVFVVMQEDLVRLVRETLGIEQIIASGHPLPQFDVHFPLLSLPGAMGINEGNIPAEIPYLRADSALVERWAGRIPKDNRRKIGLAWAGRPGHHDDRNRSLSLASFALLGSVDDTWFCSLQKGDAAGQAKSPPPGMEIVDWTDELKDFADTAALIANLDLVVTVDTSIAHLAGAMGKPVWILLPFVPDWRWMLDRTDSPWYPSARLFRQPARGDYETPMRQIADALARTLNP